MRFQPDNGETGAEVLTGGETGEASFFWEGWIREGEVILPELRIRSGTQVLDIQAYWGGERPEEA